MAQPVLLVHRVKLGRLVVLLDQLVIPVMLDLLVCRVLLGLQDRLVHKARKV